LNFHRIPIFNFSSAAIANFLSGIVSSHVAQWLFSESGQNAVSTANSKAAISFSRSRVNSAAAANPPNNPKKPRRVNFNVPSSDLPRIHDKYRLRLDAHERILGASTQRAFLLGNRHKQQFLAPR
jgi:hypothetical protein